MEKKIIEFVVTVFYVGKIKFMPGTFGSLMSFVLFGLLFYSIVTFDIYFPIANHNIYENYLLNFWIIGGVFSLLLFVIGVILIPKHIGYKSKESINNSVKGHDPSEIVIDEVVGQNIAILFSLCSIPIIVNANITEHLKISMNMIYIISLFLMPLFLFRVYDIMKPWPICWIDEKVKNGWGVMLDDVLAGIYASISQLVIVFLLVDFLNK